MKCAVLNRFPSFGHWININKAVTYPSQTPPPSNPLYVNAYNPFIAAYSRDFSRFILGTDLQNNETWKQDFHQEYFCFMVKQKYSTNRKTMKFCFSLPVGQS